MAILDGYLFSPTGEGGVPTYEALQQRRKIAAAMMSKEKGYPKNFGEGLTAIGDALGDRGLMDQLLQQEAAASAYGNKYGALPPAAETPYEPYNPYTPTTAPPNTPVTEAEFPSSGVNASYNPGDAAGFTSDYAELTRPGPGYGGSTGHFKDAFGQIDAFNKRGLSGQAAIPPKPLPPVAAAGPRAEADPNNYSYPQTASLSGTGNVQSDIPNVSGVVPASLQAQPSGLDTSAAPVPDLGIKAAPPQPSPLTAIPPPNTQLAQAATGTVSDVSQPLVQGAPQPPKVIQMDPGRAQRFNAIMNDRRLALDVRQRAATQLQQEQEKIQHRNDKQQELYQIHLRDHLQRQSAEEEFKRGAPERALKMERERQAIEKAKNPEVKQDVETGLIYNPATGAFEQPKIAGADPDRKPAFKGTEFQGKALVNYGRARLAHEGLRAGGDDVLADSPLQSTISSIPFGVGRSFRSDVYKEAETNAENFVQAFIRQQSGGAYTPTELESEARSMLPKYGDTANQIKTKREQREQFLNGLHSIIGPSGQKGVEIDAARREAERAAHPAKDIKSDPLEGREAVFPDKTIRVRRNGQWVPK